MRQEELKNVIISADTSLKTAMKTLSIITARVLFVVNEEKVLIGSLTDGDIRRAILNGFGFETQVSDIMFKKPRYVMLSDKARLESAKQMIQEEKLYAIPVLDDGKRVADVLLWYDFFEKHPHEPHASEQVSNPVVIMAGGKGERLDPFTKILPKPLIPFGDKPIIENIMDNFNKHGLVNFILTLNYRKEIIKMYLKESKFPYNVDYVEEGDDYLGTAGSLSLVSGKINETFIVSNCDVLLKCDMKNVLLWHKGEKALITMIGCHKEMTIPYGTLEVDGGKLKSINEKPTYDMIINTGVYIMEPEVFKLIKKGEKLDMNHLIERAGKSGKISVYPVCGGWFDIGQWQEYKDSLYMLKNSDK